MTLAPSNCANFAEYFRSLDWSATPLGPLRQWPQSLRTTAEIMLSSPQPAFVGWGDALTLIYNEAYLPMLGARHPRALGRAFAGVWSELWPELQPIIAETLAGKAQYFVDHPVDLAGCGPPTTRWFAFSYTPLRDETERIVGFYCAAAETTEAVLARQRRRDSETCQAFLLNLTDAIAAGSNPVAIQLGAARLLARRLKVSRVGYAEDCGDGVHFRVIRDAVNRVASIAGVYRYADFGPRILKEFAAGRTVVWPDIAADALLTDAEKAAHRRLQTAASVNVPLLVDGRLGSVLFAHHAKPKDWTPCDIAMIEATAHRLSGSLANVRLEAALLRSQARLRDAAEAAGLTYTEIDFVRNEIASAGNYAQVLGFPPVEGASGNGFDWRMSQFANRIAPEDRPKWQQALQRMRTTGHSGPVEHRVVGDDGAERWIESVGKIERDELGRFSRAFLTHLDVTAQVAGRRDLDRARRQAEEILASIGDAFYALDADWRFVYCNARAEQILGKSRSDVLGRNFFDMFPMVRGSTVHARYQSVMTEGQPVQFESVSPILKRWIAFSVYPTGGGGISVYFRDISHEKALQQELVAAKSEAEEANQAKSKFLAAASHDLRQPAQSLVLLLSVIERQVKALPKAVETARKMKQALDGLNGLLTSILDISKLEAGVVEPSLDSVDLSALLDRLKAEYAAKARSGGLDLRIRPTPLCMRSDARLLERMVRNLIENALRYTPEGGVLVGARRRGDKVRLDVIDTGIGVPPSKYDEIFREFHQLHNPGRDLQKGLGLGLAIVARTARLLGATVEVSSREGRGSRFSLLAPAAACVAPAAVATAPLEDRGGTLLIVEDNSIVRESLGAMTGHWGYQVALAASGEAAIERAARENWSFDAIVTDFALGEGADGVSAAREIARQAGRAIPTLVLTGETSAAQIAGISASGFQIAHKPIDADDLRRKLALMRSEAGTPQQEPLDRTGIVPESGQQSGSER